MGCKNCKSKKKAGEKLNKEIQSNITSFKNDLDVQKEEIAKKMFSGGASILSPFQKVLMFMFAWAPLGVGYYVIIKFIISLF